MDIQKINSDIATIEKGLNNPNINDAMKEKLKTKLASLKSQLEEGAKKAEAVAEKAEDAADDEKKSLEAVISKIRKGLDNKQVPENVKPALRKKLQEAEAKMEAIEKAAKEATTAAKEVKAEVKEAVAQVDDVIADVKKDKKVKKNAISKVKGAAKKVVAESKKRKTVATAHEKKYKDIIDELVAHVKANKKLSVVYEGASRDSLERDAARHALPPGKRVSKDGNIYYEGRRNRVDVTKRKRYPFFDEGGVLQEIPNNYKGMTSEQVWAAWYPHQKNHFIQDHIELIPHLDDLTHDETEELCNQNSFQLTLDYLTKKGVDKNDFTQALDEHIIGGQYKSGGVIENQYDGMTAEQVWDAWSTEQREHFFEDNIHFFDSKKRNTYKVLNFSDLPAVPQSYIEKHVQRGQYAKGGKVKQGNPQGQHYTEDADAQRKAKPVGYRFTEAFVNSRTGKRLKLSSNSKPTKEQIEKYLGSGVYAEARADHSDKNKRTKLEDGGGIELLGGQSNSSLKPSGYMLVKFENKKKTAIVKDEEGNMEKWAKSPNFSGYRLVIDGVDYEFASSTKEQGGPIGTGKNTYVAFYKGKKIDVKADTSHAAQQTAAQHFKAKKSYDVNVVLGMLGDEEVVHSTASLAKGGKVKGKKQAEPQGEHYTEDADAKRHAKPVGWRFTSKFLKSTAARSRGLKPNSKPTKADIEKYKDKQYPNGERYIYQETRADHSDKKKKDGL